MCCQSAISPGTGMKGGWGEGRLGSQSLSGPGMQEPPQYCMAPLEVRVAIGLQHGEGLSRPAESEGSLHLVPDQSPWIARCRLRFCAAEAS